MKDGDISHLEPGLALPRIYLPATTGEICIADAPGTSVLIVYPWTGRPGVPNPSNWDDFPGAHGSTPELEGFRDPANSQGSMLDCLALARRRRTGSARWPRGFGFPFPS